MNETLDRLARDHWDSVLETNPTHALMLGDHRFEDGFEEASLENRDIATLRRFAANAEAIPVGLETANRGFQRPVGGLHSPEKDDRTRQLA